MDAINLSGREVILEKVEDYKRIYRRRIGKKQKIILYSDIKLGSVIKRKRFSSMTGEEIRPIPVTSMVAKITPTETINCWMVKTEGSLYKVLTP